MSKQDNQSDLLVELPAEEQQVLSGGRWGWGGHRGWGGGWHRGWGWGGGWRRPWGGGWGWGGRKHGGGWGW